MKLRFLVLIAALIAPGVHYGQTTLSKTIPAQGARSISMHFDYPDLIRVSTWDKNEISVHGTVSINHGENDDAFLFESKLNGDVLEVTSRIRDIKSLPQRITIVRDGQKIIFRNKDELRKYQQEHGSGYNTMSWGADIEIALEIMVPRGVATRVESVYGMVEITNFSGPLTVEATYGGIDAAVAEKTTGEITAVTNYGEIYSNLDVKFGGDGRDRDFHTFVSATPGNGPRYSFESKYGNVYIRKAAN